MPLLPGTACAALSFAFLSVTHAEECELFAATALLVLGIGLSFASMTNLIVEAVPQEQTGEATGMNTIMRTALCLALLAAFLIPGRGAGAAAPRDVAEVPARG